MNVTLYITGDYEKNDDFGLKKQTQFKANSNPISARKMENYGKNWAQFCPVVRSSWLIG